MAFFGVDKRYCENVAEKFLHHEAIRITCPTTEAHPSHTVFRHIRPEDIVFIKSFTSQSGLMIFAVGTVLPGQVIERGGQSYLAVQWGWHGERHLPDADDTWPLRGEPVYEEFNLAIQREIINLLPDKVHDPFFMVLGSGGGATEASPYPGYQSHVEVLPHFVNPNT